MSEPQYDQTDADNYWITKENRELRSEIARLKEAQERLRVAVMVAVSDPYAQWETVRTVLRDALNLSLTGSPRIHENVLGDMACEHGTAMDVHCCGCHSGFLFDVNACTCLTPPAPPTGEDR